MTDPLAVYVHIPWCVRKCPYCDFNSHAAPSALPESDYVEALLADLAIQAGGLPAQRVTTVFFGGGTPSLFSPASIGRVLEGLATRLSLAGDAEITLEANPGTIEHRGFTGYAAAGINRVSLGAQSFATAKLAILGRIHSPRETRLAVEELRCAGIDNFNLDLMYALPGQSVAEALADVEAALQLAPPHLSHYQLSIEPGTAFHRQPPPVPPDDEAYEMQLGCQALLAGAGFVHYEVSAYALPQRQCRHNLNYWQFGDYLGLGAGAHGKLTRDGRVWRTTRPTLPGRYMKEVDSGADPVTRPVAANELPFEWALNALRLTEGGDLACFEQRTGLAASALQPTIDSLMSRGLVELKDRQLSATGLGARFLNEVQAAFLPAGD